MLTDEPDRMTVVIDWLQGLGVKTLFSTGQLKRVFFQGLDTPTTLENRMEKYRLRIWSSSVTDRVLKKLIRAGMIEKVKHGVYRIIRTELVKEWTDKANRYTTEYSI